MTKKKKKDNKGIIIGIFLVLIIIWGFGIFKLSSMNSGNSNGKSTNIINIFIEDTLDITNKYGITDSHPDESKLDKASNLLNRPLRKVMHASVYFVLAFIIVCFINYLYKNDNYLLAGILALLIIFAFAGFDEFHQTFVKGRTGDIKDVLIDTAGGLVGILFYGTYYIFYRIGYKKGLKDS